MAVLWLRLCLPKQGVQVRSLTGELRSHMPSDRNSIVTNSVTLKKKSFFKKIIIKRNFKFFYPPQQKRKPVDVKPPL